MPKGYWIVNNDITDSETYQKYKDFDSGVARDFGGKFLSRAGRQECPEGTARARTVVVEFESYDIAVECYYAAGYSAARAIRQPAAEGNFIIVEGYGD